DEVLIDYNDSKTVTLGSSGTDSSGNPDNSSAREYCVPGDSTSCGTPFGEWKIEEGSGDSIYDTSGNQRTLTRAATTSAPTWTTGKFSHALSFDGDDDAESSSFAKTYSGITWSAWIYPTTVSGDNR